MRTTTLALPLLAFAALGLLVAPAVMAGGEVGQAKSAEARANAEAMRANHTHDANETRDNDTDDDNETDGNRSPKNHTRPESRGPTNAHVPPHVTAFWTRMTELRAAWHENATQVREDCRATAAPENATGEDMSAYAQCIRDGYKDLRAWLRAELEDARADFRAGHASWKAQRQASEN